MQLTWRTFPRFYWKQFLTGFCFHLILPVILLFLAGLVLGWIGQTYGLFHLVWHERPVKQAVVGFAIFHLAWAIFLVSYLLETRRTPHAERYRLPRGGPAIAYVLGIAISSLLTLGVIVAVRAIVQALPPFRERPESAFVINPPEVHWDPPYRGIPFAIGAVLAVAVAVQFTTLHWLGPRFRPLLERLGGATHRLFTRFPLLGVHPPDEQDLFLHGVAAVSWVVSFVFFLVVALLPSWFSPVVAACCLLHGIVAIYAFFAYFLPRVIPVVIALLIVLLWVGGLPHYKQRFPGLERHYAHPLTLPGEDTSPTPALLKPDDVDFTGAARGIHPAGTKRPVVLVCASGGGLRSAAWTLSVLRQLEEQLGREEIEFPHHVRVISGASGGMLGASCYVLTLPEPGEERNTKRRAKLFDKLTEDNLSPVINQLIYGDLWSVFLPWPCDNDRGRALEQAWRDNLDGLLDVSFAELRASEKAGWRPSLVFSPMLVEDGRRLLISNLDLKDVSRSRANLLRPEKDDLLSISAFELFRLFPDERTRKDFRVATAVRMSASFPYVTPATPLPTWPRRRVVDAGYYDNYGVSVAATWLLSEDTLAWLRRHASGVLLVQIRDGLDEDERKLNGVRSDPSKPLTRGLEEATSPLEGMFAMRESAVAFRNDEQLEMLGRLLGREVRPAASDPDFFAAVTLEFGGQASLSWYLTPREKRTIEEEARTALSPRIARVAQWWLKRPREKVSP